MTIKKKSFIGTHGFTAVDNKLYYLQERLTPNAFSLLIRIHRMTEGYEGKPKALANTYFQKTCNMSKNTVTKAIKELDDLELIHTKRRPRESTLYLINFKILDSIFQEIQESIQANSIGNESQNMGIMDDSMNDESHILTQCFPYSDQHESQNMGANKENTIKENLKENTINDDVKNDVISFDDFWNAYGKKVDTARCKVKWDKLDADDHQKIMDNVIDYVAANHDKKYRKNPLTYLNGQCWLDEVIQRQPQQNNSEVNNHAAQQPKQSDSEQYRQMVREQFGQSEQPIRTVN